APSNGGEGVTSAVSSPPPLEGAGGRLLIVEDNADVAEYLLTCVSNDYQVLLAQNGQQGIEMALETVPDLIVSDVMMPEKDGFELLEFLKNDERTSHIPIILLTAKTDDASRIKGLERGADAYLSKPFNKQELLVRLRKLLELRKKLQERYGVQQFSLNQDKRPAQTNEPAQYEDAYILKIQTILNENLEDENFGVKELCAAMGVSRTQLHNKIKALTGKSTTHYIRFLRLQKARHLLLTSDKTVSEVAFEVGFRHLQHFSTSFAEEFGTPPSKVRG
ncbi:MAG: DNA-binding response regulator, partial [Saprospiraceae bacterium]